MCYNSDIKGILQEIRIIMNLCKLVNLVVKLSCFVVLLFTSILSHADEEKCIQFLKDTPDSKLKINFEPVNLLLDSTVLFMGNSRRVSAKRPPPPMGTRLRPHVAVATHNEGNRFVYEIIRDNKNEDKVLAIKKYLESIPLKTPLHLYNKSEQLAYWLNLYSVSMINEIVNRYPRVRLEKLITGTNSILDKKLISLNSIELSLNEIQSCILFNKYNKDPLIIYGLYQGYIGSSGITKKAFTGKNVYELLKNNATEFINSNRGTRLDGDTLKVSSLYERNSNYFPDFANDLKKHLLQFSNDVTREIVTESIDVEAIINNWKLADLYGSDRVFGDELAHSSKPTQTQMNRLTQLMRVRGRNLGTPTVTVTDLDSTEGNL